MPFQMSLKALIEEELMEVKSACDGAGQDIGSIVRLLDKNTEGDHLNDHLRIECRRYLLEALKALNMKDYGELHNQIHAALQKLQEQEELDIKDDIPRSEARSIVMVLQHKFSNASERIRGHLKKLNQPEGIK